MAERDPAIARLWLLTAVRLAGVGLAVSGVVVAGRAAGATATIAIGAGLMLAGAAITLLGPRMLVRRWRR